MVKYSAEDKGPPWLLVKQEKTKGKENTVLGNLTTIYEEKKKKRNKHKRILQIQLDSLFII